MDSKGDFLAGVILGALVGFGAGVLLAPASGEETRQKIKEKTDEVAGQAWDKSEELVNQAKASAEEMAAKFQKDAKEMIATIRERVSSGFCVEEALDELEDELEAETT